MKGFTLILLFAPSVLLLQPSFAQTIEWQRTYGGTRRENNETAPNNKTLLAAPDGFYFLAGTDSFDGDVTQYQKGAPGDFWLVHLSDSGNILWQKSYDNGQSDIPFTISKTDEGGFILGGVLVIQPYDTSEITWHDAWILNVDSLGKIAWERRIGGSGYDFFASTIQTTDGGFMAAGWTMSSDEWWFGQTWITNHGNSDALIVKLTSKGEIEWKKLLGGAYFEKATAILQTVDGGYIFTGGTASKNDGDVRGVHGDTNFPYLQYDIWVVRLNNAGDILWQKCFGGTRRELGNTIIATQDGGYAIAGEALSEDGDVKGLHGRSDGWFVKIDSVGNLEWQKCLGGSHDDGIASIIQRANGNYVFTGWSTSSDGDVSGLHRGSIDSADMWIGELSSSGELLWQKCLGGTQIEAGHSLVQTSDGGYAVYGTTNSNNWDVTGNHGGTDAWIVKLNPAGSSVASFSGSSGFTHPFPNPASTDMSLRLYQSIPIKQIRFYSLIGEECFPDYRIDGNTLTADIRTLPAGIYIVRVSYSGATEVQEVRKFLVSG
jgi:hypothetical protein